MSLVLALVGVVLCSLGSTLLPCLLTCLFYTAEGSTHKRNQLRAVFFLEDPGTSSSYQLYEEHDTSASQQSSFKLVVFFAGGLQGTWRGW